jgi:RimJ/RimL family protein N-acetyltransferase
MIQITPDQIATLSNWLIPERPSLIALHVLHTGNGACFVDRWPAPHAVLVTIDALCSLLGDPDVLKTDDLRHHLTGLMYTSEQFVPLLETVFPDIRSVNRIVLDLQEEPQFVVPPEVTVRRLESSDAYHLWGLSPNIRFISSTWGGPAGLAASGYAWGVFSHGKLASVACTFLVGDTYEDVGIVTEAEYRGRGLAVIAAGVLCEDIGRRGHRASWTTSTDNPASLRVAEKLGFEVQGQELLYILGQPVPAPEESRRE